MLALETQKILEKLLIERGLLDQAQLDNLRAEAAKAGHSLIAQIAQDKILGEEDLAKVTAQANGFAYADLSSVKVADNLLNLFPKDLAKSYMAVPFGEMKDRLAVGMLDPSNVQAIDFISRKIGRSIAPFLVSETSIKIILGQYRADVSKEVTAVISSAEEAARVMPKSQDKKVENVRNLVQDAPITRALNTILDYAAESRASDIHIEPREKSIKIRFRVDGILLESMDLPKEVESALISRLKILSNIKIDEHRIPQDGQFKFSHDGRDIDVRVAIAPIVYGEQVVMRLLDKGGQILTLEGLGFRGRSLRIIDQGIRQPHGMTLSTGPTGSGKSTTLYALIAQVKSPAINIVTLEDPVEYNMEGINQMQVNTEVGLTFASGLRSILRQDPNVVMVGEIRDVETADLAVQAALTGHVVLSTLHTNNAAGVLPRLLDMHVEPFLIASTVNTIIGQRLVRRICDKCIQEYPATTAQIQSITKAVGSILPKAAGDLKTVGEDLGYDNLPLANQNAYTLYKGAGCNECSNGYKGRIGIYEVFSMSPSMESLVVEHKTTSDIQAQAQKEGMITMKQDGYLKALSGLTSLEEVARVASDN